MNRPVERRGRSLGRTARLFERLGPAWFPLSVWALFSLSACALLPQPSIEIPTEQMPAQFPLAHYRQSTPGTLYEFDNAMLVIKTYRAGWLSALAHNHVISTAQVCGLARLGERSKPSADLFIRSFDLQLDDPELRVAAGPGFESQRTARDVAATRTRMLGPEGLATNQHPFITARVEPTPDRTMADVEIQVRDQLLQLTLPLSWSVSGERLVVESEFQLSHKTLGLKPYSAFAGAIGVADRIDLKLHIEAIPVDLRACHGLHPHRATDCPHSPAFAPERRCADRQ